MFKIFAKTWIPNTGTGLRSCASVRANLNETKTTGISGWSGNSNSPTQPMFMASKKNAAGRSLPGRCGGFVRFGNFKIGDTLTEGELLHFKGIPSFLLGQFRYVENADPMKQKQFVKGLDQLMDEGVAQMFTRQTDGRRIIGTVGQLQFEVIQHRLESEYNAKCRYEGVSLHKACWVSSDDPKAMAEFLDRRKRDIAKDSEGQWCFGPKRPGSCKRRRKISENQIFVYQ